MTGILDLDNLSATARLGITLLMTAHDIAPARYVFPEDLDSFLNVLRNASDEVGYFPHGKWATIQHIEAITASERIPASTPTYDTYDKKE